MRLWKILYLWHGFFNMFLKNKHKLYSLTSALASPIKITLFHLDVHVQIVLPPAEELLNLTSTRRSYSSSRCVQIVFLYIMRAALLFGVWKNM
jgi:hypothetical protein